MKKCIITMYYILDEFIKIYNKYEAHNLINTGKQRNREGNLSLSELLN